MDALELLKSDHDTVRQLFEQFNKAKDSQDTQLMQTLQLQIFTELETHTSIEEEVFYPAAEAAGPEAEELVKEGAEEHHVVDVLMQEIAQLQPSDDAWVSKMSVLIENVEHHAEEEEQELFPQLRTTFGDERLQTLGVELAEAKERHQSGGAAGDMTRDELYEKAKEQGVSGRSSMSKDELAQEVDPSS